MATVEGWRPERGDSVSGRIVELSQGYSDYQGDYYPIVTLKTKDGTEIAIHCFHAVLRNQLMNIQPNIGDRLAITYEGKKTTKDGKREVAIYKVESPDRVQDATRYWQGIGAKYPNRNAPIDRGDDVTIESDDNDVPF